MALQRFKGLSAERRAIVAIAVLLDGQEAINYLGFDSLVGSAMQKAAEELANLEVDLRMPMAGGLLREAIGELEGSQS